jgi:hypothetical protein
MPKHPEEIAQALRDNHHHPKTVVEGDLLTMEQNLAILDNGNIHT